VFDRVCEHKNGILTVVYAWDLDNCNGRLTDAEVLLINKNWNLSRYASAFVDPMDMTPRLTKARYMLVV
jgi:hypothetical protein